jgi:translation initiation factor 2B subunit (eIF-2B alpha/beta/delta family)
MPHMSANFTFSEIIMVTGKSKTVEEFLKSAHRKRKFQVIVAETAPLYEIIFRFIHFTFWILH